ncbi:type I restriction endonuclease [Neptuniibacter sp. CAU 1671]|uniref:type I restriction endonuclease n=1 Tax=Neptuniibacter sp. CAU 1671 TaxID=3032593 RepID=UPI0023DC9BD8|nr:type I restriction endonuclease [Neptuniibacter sp. CAU 1671]MDF2182839.1 type I restriction endonuclease [Neptuniibacter sp. CAU 1671]
MELSSSLANLAKKIQTHGSSLITEEATKTALVLPFLSNVLGYDVFDPNEVIPEYTADTGTKKGEKVDYAIVKNGVIQILVECKKYGEALNLKHASQLYRYFSVTNARIAILTNGSDYKFYTDLDAPNRMDEKPFLELSLEDIDEHVLPEIEKLTKSAFDVDSIISAAGELKYLSQIKKVVASQMKEPEDEFVKFIASRVYEGGIITAKVKEQFYSLSKKAFAQYINDKVNERLKSALDSSTDVPNGNSYSADLSAKTTDIVIPEDAVHFDSEKNVVTTQDELDGYNVIKAILREVVDVKRVIHRDTQSYFGVLLDDNNRKPLCRLHFNRNQKYIGLFDAEKKETRHPIESLDDIFEHASHLKKTLAYYE